MKVRPTILRAIGMASICACCSCGSSGTYDGLDAAPEDAARVDAVAVPFVDAAPRDAALPCGRGVALRWLDALVTAGARVSHLYSAPVGAGALLLWLEQHDTGDPPPAFRLGMLPDLDASTVSLVSFSPLTGAEWLIPEGSGALAIDTVDAPGALSLQWARFDAAGAGPLQQASWDLPAGVNLGSVAVCAGVSALPILLLRDDRAVGAAIVRWDSPTSAAVSDFEFPADGSLGLWGGGPGAVEPTIEGCVATGGIAYVLARPGRSGPLRLLRWADGRLIELPRGLGSADALGGVALVDASGPIFFTFDATTPSAVRAFRATTGSNVVELDAHPLDAFPYQPEPFGALLLGDGSAMLFYASGAESGILAAIGFADGRFGAPSLVSDVSCTTDSPAYPHGGRVLWPAACGVGVNTSRLGVFELCGGAP